MTKRFWCLVVATGLVVLAGPARPADKPNLYVGVKKCRTCHKKELMGNQYGDWQKGFHAKAFETLKTEKALEFAKERGLQSPPHESPDCVKCHVTAYGLEASAFAKKPLNHENGVQCESCHGPGSNYRKKKIMSDHEKSIANGMWEPGKNAEICTACHNDESPTWDAVKGFDFEAAKKKIAHPIPEDVKGRYVELEKQLRAEKRAAGGGNGEEEDEEDED